MAARDRSKLLSLAPEVVENVVKRVGDGKDLSSLRLTCQTLGEHASKELFREVLLSPAEDHIRDWSKIGQDDDIRLIPRSAIIRTQPDVTETGYREEVEVPEDFELAVAGLAKLPNLDSVHIAFTPQCLVSGEWKSSILAQTQTHEYIFDL